MNNLKHQCLFPLVNNKCAVHGCLNIKNWLAWTPETKSCWKCCFNWEQQKIYKRKNKTRQLKQTTNRFSFRKNLHFYYTIQDTTNIILYCVILGCLNNVRGHFTFFFSWLENCSAVFQVFQDMWELRLSDYSLMLQGPTLSRFSKPLAEQLTELMAAAVSGS